MEIGPIIYVLDNIKGNGDTQKRAESPKTGNTE
jgi:hypothetical protein